MKKTKPAVNPVTEDIAAYSVPSPNSIWLRAQTIFKPHRYALKKIERDETSLTLELMEAAIAMQAAWEADNPAEVISAPKKSPQNQLRHLMDMRSQSDGDTNEN